MKIIFLIYKEKNVIFVILSKIIFVFAILHLYIFSFFFKNLILKLKDLDKLDKMHENWLLEIG